MQKITRKDINTALSWARGELDHKDVIKMQGSPSQAYLYLARCLREYVLLRDEQDDELKHPSEDNRVDDR